jgi:hypothetical protein
MVRLGGGFKEADDGSTHNLFKTHTESTVQYRKNDRSDASLQVDYRAIFMVPVWRPPSPQGGNPASLPLLLGGMVSEKGGDILPLQCLLWAHRICLGFNHPFPQANTRLLDTVGKAPPHQT